MFQILKATYTHSPAQLFTRQAAQLLYSNQRLQRWCFDVELLFLAQHLEVPVVEESVHWSEIPGDHFSALMCAHTLILCLCPKLSSSGWSA